MKIDCMAVITVDGQQYLCERDDPHDGYAELHAATIEDKLTSWSNGSMA